GAEAAGVNGGAFQGANSGTHFNAWACQNFGGATRGAAATGRHRSLLTLSLPPVWDTKGAGRSSWTLLFVDFVAVTRAMGWQEEPMESGLWPGGRVLTDASATLVGGWRNVNWVNVGGLIHITNRRLIFEPVGFSLQTDSMTIPLDHIAVVRPRNTLWIIPDGM